MPRMTDAEAAAVPPLRKKVRQLEQKMGREALIDQALVLVEEGAEAGVCLPYDPRGDRAPREMVGQSLRRLLDDNGGWKQMTIDRWTYVTDALLSVTTNGKSAPEPTLLEQIVASTPPADPQAEAAEAQAKADAQVDMQLLQAAEDMLRTAEAERDAALKLAEDRKAQANETIARLREEVVGLRHELDNIRAADAGDLRTAYFNALIDSLAKSADPGPGERGA